MALAAGTVLAGRYRVLRRLGEGGMGSVYQVEDLTRPGVVWALKELLDDPNATPEDIAWARRRFEDEIALMRALRHPRLPAFVEALSGPGPRAFVMEFIPGQTLEERLRAAHGPLPERDVLQWMLGVCDALAYLHGRQPPIIVRDLKPANIMVTPAGDVRLIDLGIARTYKPGKQSNTENLGTMTYASPEHLGQTQTDARSDVYSLGATMFHLLTGHEPSPMETPAPGSLRRYVPTLSEPTEALVIRAMRLDPAQRFQGARDLRDALSRCLALLPRPAATATAGPGVSRAPVATLPIPTVRTGAARGVVGVPTASPSVSSVCPRCGFVNRAGAKFCAHDGAPLGVPQPPGSAARPSSPPTRPSPSPAGPASPVPPYMPRPTSGGVPTTAALSVQRATESFAAGRYAQTVRGCQAAIAQGRTTADVYLLLGRACRALGRRREAAEAFAEAAGRQPSAEALALEGEEWRAVGEPARALVAFTRARQLDPRNPDLALRIGLVCLDLGQLAQAEGELRDALAAHPDSAPPLIALARVYAARGDWEGAVTQARAALAVAPSDAAAHVELGRALLAQRKHAEAVRTLERAVKLVPADGEAHRLLSAAYQATGQRSRARDALRRALDRDPADAEAKRLLAQL